MSIEIRSSTITISQSYIFHIKNIIEKYKDETRFIPMEDGLPCYILSIAALETFLNEFFINNSFCKGIYNKSVLWKFKDIEKINVLNKLLTTTYFLFNKTFEIDMQPFQDVQLLVEIRNKLIHYKMKSEKKFTQNLDNKKITKKYIHPKYKWDYPWPEKTCCISGILWAHNTVCKTINFIYNLIENQDFKNFIKPAIEINFSEIKN